MKSLTYGNLPSFDTFHEAFIEQTGGTYEINCPPTSADYRMLQDLELDHFGSYCSDEDGVEMRLSCLEMYALLEALVIVYESADQYIEDSIDAADAADWAGDFASGILSTLGFKWI